MHNYQNIPAEMRDYKQWVVWRYEESIEGKPTKVPYNAVSNYKASVTNSNDWASFSDAFMAATSGKYDGLGFVLTANDPFVFIDLDTPKDKTAEEFQAIQERQNKIFNSFQSYAELSPSGTGAHIIVKGDIPSGRKRSSIEIYSKERYMTMTGNIIPGSEPKIREYHELANVLWSEMGNKVEYLMHDGNAPQTKTDAEVIASACNAINGEKVIDLARDGDWPKYYSSQSEADFALIDVIAFYTQNREQITRIFQQSALGQRDKAKRRDYMEYMISKSFDNLLPPIDTDGLYNAIAEQIAKQKGEAFQPQQKPDNHLVTHAGNDFALPPGLLGSIAKFIYDAAPRPVPEIALAGAIGLMAGITGRAYNVSSTGLNNYVLLLAGTGRGKEAIASGINKLIHSVSQSTISARDFIGPSEIASPQGLIKAMTSKPCFVSIVGEFGMHLQSMQGGHASSAMIGLRRAWLDLYNKSGKGQAFNGSAYSQLDRKIDPIDSPAFSMIGESNPLKFYKSIDEESISDGLLPRLTVIEYNGPATDLNDNHASAEPSEQLKMELSQLIATCTLMGSSKQNVDVGLTEDALSLSKELAAECLRNVNSEQGGIVSELWNRVHLRTLKLAALYAVGVNQHLPMIDAAAFMWAKKIVIAGVIKIISRFEKGMIGESDSESNQIQEIIRICNDYYKSEYKASNRITRELFDMHVIPYKYFWDRAHNLSAFAKDKMKAKIAIKRAVEIMVETEQLVDVTASKKAANGNSPMRLYMVADVSLINVK